MTTIFLIIGNAFCAILLTVFLTKYLSLKKSSDQEIANLRHEVETELKEILTAENQMRDSVMNDNKKIESLLEDLTKARQEKEEEIRLRLEAEKQIALSIQKAEDIQKRMIDWRTAQEAAMQDSQNAIIKVGEDLYQKINASHQAEIETNKHLFEKVSEYIEKTSVRHEALHEKAVEVVKAPEKAKETVATSNPQATPEAKSSREDVSKKLVADLVKSMQESGHLDGEKYFLASSFDAANTKLFLCETAFLQDSHLYILDFKACNFLHEYSQSDDKSAAKKTLEQKLDKYVAYLGNPKYRGAIVKAATAKNIKFDNGDVIVVVSSNLDLEVLQEIGYLEKLENTEAKIATFDEIIDLTL